MTFNPSDVVYPPQMVTRTVMARCVAALALAWLMPLGLEHRVASAMHSRFYPQEFYDLDDDGHADDGPIVFLAVAAYTWEDTNAFERLKDAALEWRTNSDFYVKVQLGSYTESTRRYYRNGYLTPCLSSWSVKAVACIDPSGGKQYRDPPGGGNAYYRVIKQYVSFSDELDWYYGTGSTPAGKEDFLGIATHEMGHTVVLRDINGCYPDGPYPTMCSGLPLPESENRRTLNNDDITGANSIYPPGDEFP